MSTYMQINDIIQRYLDYMRNERNMSDRTVRGYGYELRLFATVVGEDMDVEHLDHEQVLAFLNRLGPNGSPLRPQSRNRKLIVLRGFFKYVRREKIIRNEKDPTRNVEWVSTPQIESPCFTSIDYQALLASFPENNSPWLLTRDKSIIHVLFHTGIRVNELVSILTSQVDLNGAVLTGLLRKGNSLRTLPLNKTVVAELRRWMKVREDRRALTDHLFISRYRRGLSTRQVQRRLSDLGKRAGIPIPLKPHSLRHLHATELLKLRANPKAVQKLMNHRSISTTMLYSHVGFDELRETVELLTEDRS